LLLWKESKITLDYIGRSQLGNLGLAVLLFPESRAMAVGAAITMASKGDRQHQYNWPADGEALRLPTVLPVTTDMVELAGTMP